MQINILNKYANFRKLCKFLDITIYDKTMLYKKCTILVLTKFQLYKIYRPQIFFNMIAKSKSNLMVYHKSIIISLNRLQSRSSLPHQELIRV